MPNEVEVVVLVVEEAVGREGKALVVVLEDEEEMQAAWALAARSREREMLGVCILRWFVGYIVIVMSLKRVGIVPARGGYKKEVMNESVRRTSSQNCKE